MGCSFQEFLTNPAQGSISCIGGFFSWASGGIIGGVQWLGDQIKIGLKGVWDAIRPYWIYILGIGVAIFGIVAWRSGGILSAIPKLAGAIL